MKFFTRCKEFMEDNILGHPLVVGLSLAGILIMIGVALDYLYPEDVPDALATVTNLEAYLAETVTDKPLADCIRLSVYRDLRVNNSGLKVSSYPGYKISCEAVVAASRMGYGYDSNGNLVKTEEGGDE